MRPLAICATFCAMGLMAVSAFAQAPAGAKQRGEYNYYGSSASSALRSAREYSQNYGTYAKAESKVNPEVSKDAADSIGQYIAKAQKHFAAMRKAAAGDKSTLAALDSIDKHMAAAAKSHAEMAETCLKDVVDGKALLDCCKVVDEHLAKAIAEHDKLMKSLKK